jgi:hypothetical protein
MTFHSGTELFSFHPRSGVFGWELFILIITEIYRSRELGEYKKVLKEIEFAPKKALS